MSTDRRSPITDHRSLTHRSPESVGTNSWAAVGRLARRSQQLATLLSALPASLFARLAMFHRIVLRAFIRASFADLSAGLADQVDKFAIAAHIGHRESAHVRAIHVELDAARQMRKVLFFQTRDRAFVASHRAVIAGIYARSHLFIHDVSR